MKDEDPCFSIDHPYHLFLLSVNIPIKFNKAFFVPIICQGTFQAKLGFNLQQQNQN